MSFIAVCDQCNHREVFEMPHSQSLGKATQKGWLIADDQKLCPHCHRGAKAMEIITKPEPEQQLIVEEIKEKIIETVVRFAIDHPHINSPLTVLARQLQMAEMSVMKSSSDQSVKKGENNGA